MQRMYVESLWTIANYLYKELMPFLTTKTDVAEADPKKPEGGGGRSAVPRPPVAGAPAAEERRFHRAQALEQNRREFAAILAESEPKFDCSQSTHGTRTSAEASATPTSVASQLHDAVETMNARVFYLLHKRVKDQFVIDTYRNLVHDGTAYLTRNYLKVEADLRELRASPGLYLERMLKTEWLRALARKKRTCTSEDFCEAASKTRTRPSVLPSHPYSPEIVEPNHMAPIVVGMAFYRQGLFLMEDGILASLEALFWLPIARRRSVCSLLQDKDCFWLTPDEAEILRLARSARQMGSQLGDVTVPSDERKKCDSTSKLSL
ncbi:unnamed protein product [Amoebophrya sp. A120]|nr:unnamed protein product [Amoebophrya sp. A120]|eukprot:GSA120T00012189001.1